MKAFLVVLLGLMAAGGATGLWFWREASNHTATFRTAAVERGNLVASISATGTVEPEEVIDIGAQVAGQIKEFGRDPRDSSKSIDYGSVVEAGTVLAKIEDALYAAEVDNAQAQVGQATANVQKAKADLVQAQARFRLADRDWKRAQDLRPRRAIADAEYESFQSAFETAKASLPGAEAAVVQAEKAVETAKAVLRKAQTNLGYTTIRSPVKGVIVDRRVNVGQTVVASLNAPSLFLIAKDLRRLQVWASVNEADIGSIRAGQTVRFTVDAHPDELFRGAVAQIRLNAVMTQNVVTYTVIVNTDNSEGKLLPYLTANVQFEVSERTNVLLVPNAALRWRPQIPQVAPAARDAYAKSLRRRNNGSNDAKATTGAESERHDRGTVWVPDNGYVRPVKIRTGLTDGSMTEVVSGDLEEGADVVVAEIRQNDGDKASNPFTPQVFGGRKKSDQ